MILDKNLQFLDDGDAANEAGTTLLGDVIDIGVARDIGNGQPLFLVVQVRTAADGGSGAGGLLALQLVSDSVAAIATDGTQTIHFTSDVLTAAQLSAGSRFVFAIPYGDTGPGHGYERFVGIQGVQTIEGEDDLTLDAFLTNHPPADWVSTADASN